MKKLFALILAMVMIFSLATTAFAAETTGTVKNATDRAYKAYQIFSGTQAVGTEVLGDIEWGSGINSADFLAELKKIDAYKDCASAADVANVLKGVNDESATAQAFANLAEKYLTTTATDIPASNSASLPSGYYLLVDQTVATGHTAKNPALLQVTNGTLTITDKSGKPTMEKKVNNADSADVNIGDKVTFTLTATMPQTFEGYDTYKVVFHDTMSKGLTYNNDATVSVDGFTTTINTDANNTIITITNNNVLAQNVTAGSIITVTYTATLNADAIVGAAGNSNKAHLEYSNDPNWDSTSDSDDEPTGNTPEDEVKVYTWDMGVLKYADNDKTKVLEGVKFILLNNDKSKIAKVANGKIVSWDTYTADMTVTAYELSTDKDGKISVAGLASGNYYLRETQPLPGYNKLTEDTQIKVEGKLEGYQTSVAEVNNNSGATLPETGGMGTTLFYFIGGMMMLAAVVLLVTKKRMATAE